jgi:hypothetical protein
MMSMNFSQLRTYWEADDAHLVISFLDELRDTLWATYGAEIIEQQQTNQSPPDHNDQLFSN